MSSSTQSQVYQTSSGLDYMYVNRQYGDILYVSDDSDGEDSYESIIHIPEETEAGTTNTFTENAWEFHRGLT